MEKRFITFLLLSLTLMVGYSIFLQALFGPPNKAQVAQVDQAEPGAGGEADDANGENSGAQSDRPIAKLSGGADEPNDGTTGQETVLGNSADDNGGSDGATAEDANTTDERTAAAESEKAAPPSEPVPAQWITLGSLDPESPYQMLAVFSNVGGSLQSVELSNPRYRELNRRFGYLGYLALEEDNREGCLIQCVGPGSPAAAATSAGVKGGLRGPKYKSVDGQQVLENPADRIVGFNGTPIASRLDFQNALEKTKPGQQVEINIERTTGEQTSELTFTTTLTDAPLRVINVEPTVPSEDEPEHPASYLLTLCQIGMEKARFGEDEIAGLPSLREATWSATNLPANATHGPGVEFRTDLPQAALEKLNLDGPIELVKRFRLQQIERSEQEQGNEVLGANGFLIQFDFEIINRSDVDQKIAYQLDGPTGLTTEGWWYLYKSHPTKFSMAGARDIAWREVGSKHKLFVCSQITKRAKDDDDSPVVPMTDSEGDIQMRYAGLDTQYFAAVLMPRGENQERSQSALSDLESAVAQAIGPLDKYSKRTDVTFRLKSRLQNIAANESLQRSFDIYVGPKQQEVLEEFGLQDFIVYGWFGWVSKPMIWLLHQFYWLTGKFSYGIAIILLTVCVRAAMYPTGRKMALNAQKMQELAPEMKKLADKYKNDMEKRAEAQKELFAKHGYNPLSGCMVMFIQMPVFLGLYRGLSCDIALRQAPLIPGMQWCSNLAGPDMLWYWKDTVPSFLSIPYGIFGLGPYFNVLPILAVTLFIAQQKLFTPPPQDEQQAMQHQIMKFMMIFMGLIFFKMASGLILYIIVSTCWGLGERLLLPKPGAKKNVTQPEPAVVGATASGNSGGGSSKKRRKKRR